MQPASALQRFAQMLGLAPSAAEDALHSERAARAVLSRRDLLAASGALAGASLFSFAKPTMALGEIRVVGVMLWGQSNAAALAEPSPVFHYAANEFAKFSHVISAPVFGAPFQEGTGVRAIINRAAFRECSPGCRCSRCVRARDSQSIIREAQAREALQMPLAKKV